MSTSRLLIGGAILSVLIGGMAAFKRPEANLASAQSLHPTPSPSVSPQVATSPAASPIPAPVQPAAPNYSSYQAHRITTCAGQESNANFREFPSLSSTAILGAVRHGDLVYLTGRTVSQNGVIWYEAISPSLFPVPDVGAINNTQPNQVGWIASCFVSG